MNARAAIAKKLESLNAVLVVLGGIGALGFLIMFITALSGETPNSTLALFAVAYCVAMWTGFGWMILVSTAIGELLVPTDTEKP